MDVVLADDSMLGDCLHERRPGGSNPPARAEFLSAPPTKAESAEYQHQHYDEDDQVLVGHLVSSIEPSRGRPGRSPPEATPRRLNVHGSCPPEDVTAWNSMDRKRAGSYQLK